MSIRNFPTALGVASVWWNEKGLTRFHLPDEKARIAGGAVPLAPPHIEDLIHSVQEHFSGKLHDFTHIVLDWSQVTPFQKKVYVAALAVKAGHTTTYGEIARQLGLGPEGARAVGVALGANPWPLIVPCHRVVAADGKMTGFSAPGGISTKTRLLALEGAELSFG
ncbi:MAG TPA: methylated-DNA--[protein]-cysteine S-methyltransferase [Candidatus Methylacidiphilales bacterium]|jgi:methylated-DNA-[protein]-cysteine S-methyltransferase|nr:methylated-DNA--[protein]-cysteine S-methyltransferase [Candidatus Methylacidiphilales bacterium]